MDATQDVIVIDGVDGVQWHLAVGSFFFLVKSQIHSVDEWKKSRCCRAAYAEAMLCVIRT